MSTTTALNITQVMARLGICRDKVYSEIRSGRLIARKLGGRTLVLESDLEKFLQSLPQLGREAAS